MSNSKTELIEIQELLISKYKEAINKDDYMTSEKLLSQIEKLTPIIRLPDLAK